MHKRHRFPPEIIQHVVWLYHRFDLSARDIEDLKSEHYRFFRQRAFASWKSAAAV